MDHRPNDGKALSKYERTHVIGVRAEQLARGAQAFVDAPPDASAIDIAEREFAAGRMPFIVKRDLCDGTHELLSLNQAPPNQNLDANAER